MAELKGKDFSPLEHSDKELMLRLRSGDMSAFKTLYDRFVRRVFSMAYRFSRDYETSRDITQEVFLRLFQKKNLYNPEISFNTFFYRLAYNCILNYIRDHKDKLNLDDSANYIFSTNSTPEQSTIANELAKNIEKRLGELPHNQKIAFILNKIEGLSYEEVAEVMETNINTVKSLIHRATMSILEMKDE